MGNKLRIFDQLVPTLIDFIHINPIITDNIVTFIKLTHLYKIKQKVATKQLIATNKRQKKSVQKIQHRLKLVIVSKNLKNIIQIQNNQLKIKQFYTQLIELDASIKS